jgi:hypothetical protein
MKTKTLGLLITAALMTAAIPVDKIKADNPGTLMKDVNFDGVINAVDASMVLAEYARTSAGLEPTFTHTQAYVADTDFDRQVTAVDASRILKTYSLESSGTDVPIKTVIFGITADGQPLNFQSLTVEGAEQYIDSMTDGRNYTIIADTTIYQGENVIKKAYIMEK